MQKRNVLNSSRLSKLKKHRQRVVLNKILLSFFAFLIVFFLVAYVSHLHALNINKIEVVGNKIVDTNTITATIQEQISGKYLWLFPKTNILFYPENSIKKELQNKFKRLDNINLSVKTNKTLEVSVTERVAKYTWCGIVPPSSITPIPDVGLPQSGIPTSGIGDCYFMDESGYIFDTAPYFSGEVYFKFYGVPDVVDSDVGLPQSGIPTSGTDPLGSYFLKQNFQQMASFKDTLIGLGLKPVALYITNDGDAEFFLSNGNLATPGPKIILRTDSDFQSVAENLESALTTEPLQSEFKNKYSTLQYINLKFGNKIYYKFK